MDQWINGADYNVMVRVLLLQVMEPCRCYLSSLFIFNFKPLPFEWPELGSDKPRFKTRENKDVE